LQIFAETFVERMDWNSCLSIVTFSNEASTILKMTQMNQSGQVRMPLTRVNFMLALSFLSVKSNKISKFNVNGRKS